MGGRPYHATDDWNGGGDIFESSAGGVVYVSRLASRR